MSRVIENLKEVKESFSRASMAYYPKTVSSIIEHYVECRHRRFNSASLHRLSLRSAETSSFKKEAATWVVGVLIEGNGVTTLAVTSGGKVRDFLGASTASPKLRRSVVVLLSRVE